MLKQTLITKTTPKANDDQIIEQYGLRITYLTPRLIRVESGKYTDLASYAVWNRQFEAGTMKVSKEAKSVFVETEDVIFEIKNKRPFSVYFKDTKNTEIFSKQKNLKGTCRTLDGVEGSTSLQNGLITKEGAYLLEDKSVLLDESGHFSARSDNSKDYYLFAYGKDYRGTIKAFYDISSPTPLIPRFALGNWWSRYHAYTQKEYLDLMKKFKKDGIPLTVATIDMDWHWVHGIEQKFGTKYGGWTGYSWNTELFPDYKEFFNTLKNDNLHITLNLHPADGVHCYEDMYDTMAKAVGIDPKTKQKVDFKCGSDEFWNAYFDVLHKPYERDGVDFWWIDWQQGKNSDVDGLDPLNALNHYHYLDNAEDGRMPMILSRYAGIGSHRYPLGFSGDTYITWKTLEFQPYFTNTATNAGYSWWSHDIGGHQGGIKDDNLYLRWVQYGVLSPIMRLHSTAWELLGKEPWKYRDDIHNSAKYWLNLRHKLIPYIFTMDHRTHNEGIALCEPMYYSYPSNDNAYSVLNQYMFGSEMMVCPITSPQHKEINMGSVDAWIPEGRWVDIFTGKAYSGDQKVTLYRDMHTIPVLAKEGAIIPMSADKGNKTENPSSFEIWAFSGNGEFTLIEDNGRTDFAEHTAKTKFEIKYANEKITFVVNKVDGDTAVIPEKRSYKILVKDIVVDDEPLVIEINDASTSETHTKTIANAKRTKDDEPREIVIEMMSRWQERNRKKNKTYKPFESLTTKTDILMALENSSMPTAVAGAIKEQLV